MDLVVLRGHFELSQVLAKLNDRVSSHSWQDRAVQRWRDQFILSLFVLPEDEEIHGADLCDIVMQQPQHLISTELLIALSAGSECGSIVPISLT